MHTRCREPRIAALLALVLLGTACSINPATGKRQFSLYGEQSEIAIGREADPAIQQSMGLYDDAELQAYVQQLGGGLAANSERPSLPWTFRLVDDPVVNAFALPGGYIYVTRGILAHLNSEAELAGVLGHEIGHVTARHGVNQMSKQQLFGGLLGASVLVEPGLASYVEPLQTGLSLMFLKFGRDDEMQADDLGLRYMQREGYDPRPMAEVFDVLRRVTEQAGGGSVPGWASTHPAPERRGQRILDQLAAAPQGGTIGRAEYVARLDGMTFGEDPREGYFKDAAFFHPSMEFRFDFPGGWKTANTRLAVIGGSPAQNAAIRITLSSAATVAEATEQFFKQQGITRGDPWRSQLHGLPAASSYYSVQDEQQALGGVVAFVEHGGSVLRLLGVATQDGWTASRAAVEQALASFRPLIDRAALAVRPARLKIVSVSSPTTLRRLAAGHATSAGLETLAMVNDVDPDATLPVGRSIKLIVGGELP